MSYKVERIENKDPIKHLEASKSSITLTKKNFQYKISCTKFLEKHFQDYTYDLSLFFLLN